MKQKRQKTHHQRSRPKRSKRRSPLFTLEKKHGLLALALFFLLACAAAWRWVPTRYPIESVEVVGIHPHVSSSALTNVVTPYLAPGFFRVDAQALREALLENAWLAEVSIKRVWPNKLVIKLEEHQPIVRFDDTHLISAQGELIAVLPTDAEQQMPLFMGPIAQWAQMFSQYHYFNDTLEKTGLRIVQLSLAPWGSWRLKLDNDLVIYLGKSEVDARLSRFVTAYEKSLHQKIDKIATVDLRYTSGLSVGWKNKR